MLSSHENRFRLSRCQCFAYLQLRDCCEPLKKSQKPFVESYVTCYSVTDLKNFPYHLHVDRDIRKTTGTFWITLVGLFRVISYLSPRVIMITLQSVLNHISIIYPITYRINQKTKENFLILRTMRIYSFTGGRIHGCWVGVKWCPT